MTAYNEGGNRKGNKFPPVRLTQTEVEAILDTCSKAKTSLRDSAILHIMARPVLRHAEVLALMPRDISYEDRSITVQKGKGTDGGKFRVVGLDRRTEAAIRAWREFRSTLDLPRGAPLFCTITKDIGKPLTQRAIRHMVKTRTKRAGIDKRVTPHVFRHARAIAMAEAKDSNGGQKYSLSEIQQVLGHSNIATTSVYLQRINPELGLAVIRELE